MALNPNDESHIGSSLQREVSTGEMVSVDLSNNSTQNPILGQGEAHNCIKTYLNKHIKTPIDEFFYPKAYIRSEACPKIKVQASPVHDVSKNYKEGTIINLEKLVSKLALYEEEYGQPDDYTVNEFIDELEGFRDKARAITSKVGGVFFNAAKALPEVRALNSVWCSQTIDFDHPQFDTEITELKVLATEVESSVDSGRGSLVKAIMKQSICLDIADEIIDLVDELPKNFGKASSIFEADVKYLIETFNMDAATQKGYNMKALLHDGRTYFLFAVSGIGFLYSFAILHHEAEMKTALVTFGAFFLAHLTAYLTPSEVYGSLQNAICWRDRYAHKRHLEDGIAHALYHENNVSLELKTSEASANSLAKEVSESWAQLKGILNPFSIPPNAYIQEVTQMDEISEKVEKARRKLKGEAPTRRFMVDGDDPYLSYRTEIFIQNFLEKMVGMAQVRDQLSDDYKHHLQNRNVHSLQQMSGLANIYPDHLLLGEQWQKHGALIRANILLAKNASSREDLQKIANFFDRWQNDLTKHDKVARNRHQDIGHLSKFFSRVIRRSSWISTGVFGGILFQMLGLFFLKFAELTNLDKGWIAFWVVYAIGCALIVVPILLYLCSSVPSQATKLALKNCGTDRHS